jgi:hypothetical protein
VAAAESAGVVAAAASTTTDDRLRRELITAWKAINRATPTATSTGVTVAPGDADLMRITDADGQSVRPSIAWPEQTPTLNTGTQEIQEISVLLAGASRVLMASRLADAPHHAAVDALLIQAAQLAAQICRTIAARHDATHAQQRAAEATARAAELAGGGSGRAGGWQFAKSGAQVLDTARIARAAGLDTTVAAPGVTAPGQDFQQPRAGPVIGTQLHAAIW